jgi:hypothetical protein
MERACSVLLFCCAIDPFLSLMPDIKVKRVYMDDTTRGDPNLAKIKDIQKLINSQSEEVRSIEGNLSNYVRKIKK